MGKKTNVMESVEKLLREFKNGKLKNIMVETSFKDIHILEGKGFSSTIHNPEVLTIHFTRYAEEGKPVDENI